MKTEQQQQEKPAQLPSVFKKQCTASCCESQLVIKQKVKRKKKNNNNKHGEKCITPAAIQLYLTQCENVTFNSIILIVHRKKKISQSVTNRRAMNWSEPSSFRKMHIFLFRSVTWSIVQCTCRTKNSYCCCNESPHQHLYRFTDGWDVYFCAIIHFQIKVSRIKAKRVRRMRKNHNPDDDDISYTEKQLHK